MKTSPKKNWGGRAIKKYANVLLRLIDTKELRVHGLNTYAILQRENMNVSETAFQKVELLGKLQSGILLKFLFSLQQA